MATTKFSDAEYNEIVSPAGIAFPTDGDRMIVFQWSAVPVSGRSGSALRIIRRWAHSEQSDLGWPAGRVFRNSRDCDCITVEYCFEDMGSFERAWERLMQSEEAASLWEELRPLLDEDRTDRQLFSVKYARTHAT